MSEENVRKELDGEDRTRMLQLARDAEPEPLALAIELALTTGMRRGEMGWVRTARSVDSCSTICR